VYSTCRVIQSADELKSMVEKLTREYESAFTSPWNPTYNEYLLKGIVGIELSITEIQCKFKLSQNRSEIDRNGVISALEEHGSTGLAKAMRENES